MTDADAERSEQPLILATDIDGTFVNGPSESRRQLYAILKQRSHSSLIYVTERYIESARAFQELLGLPRPDLFIADAGSYVASGRRDTHDEWIDAMVEGGWPGADAIRAALVDVADVVEERPIIARRRLSFLIRPDVTAWEALIRVREALSALHINVECTSHKQLDVLPANVDKGVALRRVLSWLRADDGWVVVAGDSLSDAKLFRQELHGVVVGDAEPELKRMVAERDDVYQSRSSGAAGVLEGLEHFGFVHSADRQN